MYEVKRIDEKLAEADRPDLVPVQTAGLADEDTLIICAGFEDRATEVLARVIRSGGPRFSVLMLEYSPVVKENRDGDIRRLCFGAGLSLQTFVYDRRNPADAGNRLLEKLRDVKGRLCIDVSAMSRLLIVQVLTALGQRAERFRGTTIFYVEALEYPPRQQEVTNELEKQTADSTDAVVFLSSGVFDVTVVPELSSVAMQGQPICLVVFPSFNSDQLTTLRTEIQASRTLIVHGRPPRPENAWRPEAIRRLNRIRPATRLEETTASTLDYQETLAFLLNAYAKYGTMERLIVAPTGSKMQSVAIGIFRAYMEDVQVVYPTPRSFDARNYTEGARQVYRLDLDELPVL